MDVAQHLEQLEKTRDWQGLANALERAIESEDDAGKKSAYFLRLGRVMTEKLLQGPRALRHFQTAWKLQPQSVEPLQDARNVYWELGKFKMVETVIRRSLESASDELKGPMLLELGDVCCDLGNYDVARDWYQQAQSFDSVAAEASASLEDLASGGTSWEERMDDLVGEAVDTADTDARVRLLLRAARIARRFESDQYEELLLSAYQADCDNRQAAALYEELMVADGRLAQVLNTQREMLEAASTDNGPRLAFRYGVRWATRHQNVELGASLLEQAVLGDPSNDAAFTFLRELWGTHGDDWQRVLNLCEQIAENPDAPSYVLAEAGKLCWLKLGDLIRAKQWFSRLAEVDTSNLDLANFEAQIGESLSSPEASAGDAPPIEDLDTSDVETLADETSSEPVADAETLAALDVESVHDDVDDIPEPPMLQSEPPQDSVAPESEAPVSSDAPAASEPPAPSDEGEAEPDSEPASDEAVTDDVDGAPGTPEPPAAAREDSEPAGPQDDALIAELQAEAKQHQKARRNHDYVKTLVKLAEAHSGRADKIDYYEKAAGVYQKFSNAAEASKCFEAILELNGDHDEARSFLRDYYEKRRDWENLIGLMRSEADAADDPDVRLSRYVEMAQLATERIKKPPVCIELWSLVRELDPSNPDALSSLGMFYERARDWENLAVVLTEQIESTADDDARLKMLEKLGQIQGDRLKNDEAAADAWRQVLELNPTDRRAQENLKKKLLALGRWDDLELLYEESDKWDEFIRLLESHESREKDPDTKIGLLLKVADLWESKKQKLDRAARAYEKILKIDEQNLTAAEALIPIYQDAGNAKGLAEAIEVKLEHSEEATDRVDLLAQVGELYETKLRKPDLALERFLQAMQLDPRNFDFAEAVERVASATSKWDQLVNAYQGALGQVEDPSVEALMRSRLGRVYLEQLQKVDEALEQYRAVYELEPENGEALEALERLYRETERYTELLHVYERQRDLVATPDAQCRVLYGIAELYEGELSDPDSATQTYWQVLEIEPTDDRALEALDRLYLAQENWSQYAGVLRKRLETDVAEELLVDLKFRLGKTLEQHLEDAAGALEHYREILYVDPNNDDGRVALEGLLERAELSGEVARILAEVYEGRDEWDKLIGALEILVSAEHDADERVSLLRKIAAVAAEQLQDAARAFAAQSRALIDMPESRDVQSELEHFAEQAEAYEGLAKVYIDIASTLTDAGLARDYWMRLAQIQQALAQIDEAAASYQRVLEIDPSDGESLDAMESLFSEHERWTDLISVIRRRIDLCEDMADREQLFAQMAQVFDERLGQPEESIAAYSEVLSFDDTSATALAALDDLFSRQEMWMELSENLEQQLRLASDEQSEIGIMLRLSALQESKLEQVEAAIETYRQVLDREPQNAGAVAALERLGQNAQFEIEIAEILGPLYRDLGDYQKLLGVYEVQVRRSEDPLRAVDLLHEMAQLHEDAGGDFNAAFQTFARALQLDPASDRTRDGMERLAAATDRFPDLATVYEELAVAQEDRELAIQLYTLSANVYEHQLGAVDQAVAHYRRILELDAQHLGAVEALENIFQGSDRYQELSAVLQQRAELLHDLDEQKSALMRSAQIEEEVLEHTDSAVAVYLKVLDIDPEDLRALDALIKLYVGMEKWPELLEVYNRKVDLVFDADERKRIYYQMGAVYERELGQVRSAIDTYQRVLEIDPDDLEALGRLDVLYQQAEDWPELLTILQREADLAGDPNESISYQYRIAELYDKRLEDVQRSIELYRDLLGQQPDHQPTLSALEALTQGDRAPLDAAQVLEPIYEAMGEWHRLIASLEVQGKVTDDEYQRVDLLQRIARLYEEMISDPNAAFDTFARAVASDPTNDDSLAQYERLAMMTGRWADLAQMYDAQLDRVAEDPVRFAEIGLRLARIYEEQLEDFDNAIGRYSRVLESDPENVAAISSLDRLFEYTERWQELAQVLEREADLATSAEEILGYRFRLGQTRQYRLDDLDGAIAAYGQVLTEMPDHEHALTALEGLFNDGVQQLRIAEILEPHYENLAQFEHLAGVYEATLAHMTEPADRLAQYYRLAELHEERLLQADGALAMYIRALQEYPSDERCLDEVERLAGMVNDGWEHQANAYADVLGTHEDLETQKTIGKRLARVFEEELGDVQKAEETYRYVLSVSPLEIDCLENLDRIYSGMEQYAELAQVLEQRVQTTDDQYQLIEFYTRMGEVYEQRLGQLDDAVRAYKKTLDDLDPTNEQAQMVLERIYAHQQKWQELYGVYERQLESAAGDYEQADILAKMGRLLADYLGDNARAIATWMRVLDLRGEDGDALGALSDLYERTEQWAELTEILERHMGQVIDGGEQVAVLLRRARLFSAQLGRDDSALDDYNQILDIDPENVEALYAINDIWRRREDPQELAMAVQQTVDRAAANLPADHLVALYRELATLHQLDPDQSFEAIEAWRRLLETDPGDFDAMSHLETLLRAEERWEEVVDVKSMRAAAFDDPSEQIREYLEVAHIWEHQVGNEDGATPALEAVLAKQPTHDDAFEQLARLHRNATRWEPLIELYLNRIETREDVADQTGLLRKVAKVFDQQLGDYEQAFEALQTAFELDYNDEDTVAYLEKMAAATKRWPGLVQLVNGWLEGAQDPAAQVALSLRLAKWYGEDLDRPDYAQPLYAKVAELDPNNVQARRQMASYLRKQGDWRQAGVMLEQAQRAATRESDRAAIFTDLGDLLEKVPEQEDKRLSYYQRALDADGYYVPALQSLEMIYEAKNMTAELADVLGKKATGLKDDTDAADVRLRQAGLLESVLGRPDEAIDAYRAVLEVDGGNVLAMRGLERVYIATQKWPELSEVLEMHLDVAATERERSEVLLHIAQLQEEQFLKPDLAATRLEQVVELDPTNQAAFESLARCYHKQRQWLELIGSVERYINAADSREKKVELFGQIATTYADHLQDQERALDAYLNIVDLDPNQVPALEALAKLYERMDDPANAIDYMSRVADLTVDGGQRVEAFYHIGKQLDEKLGDRVQARERFEQALDLDPTHLPTLAALRTIAMDEVDWDLASRYLETEQQHTEAPRARSRLLTELGRIRAEMLEQPEAALEAYQLAHQADPDNEDAALPLARRYVDGANYEAAEPLTEMLVRKSAQKERDEQFEMNMLHGRVEMEMSKPDQALRAYQVAHKLDLTNQEAIRGLAEANFQLGDWAGALTNYQKVLTTLSEDDVELRAEVYFKLGCVKREQGQGKQAINNFEKGLQIDPNHRPTLGALVGIYEGLNDWTQACAYRQQEIDNVLDGEERYALLNDLAGIWRDKVGDPHQALGAYERAAELQPDDHQLLHQMLTLYQKTDQWDRMVEVLQRIAESDPKPDRRARYLFTMAQVYRDKLNDPYHAAELFDEALDLNPEYLDSFKRIDKIYTTLKDWGKLERSYRKMIHRIVGKGKVDLEYNLWHALGLIYRDRVGDLERAHDAFSAALNVRPEAQEERQILAELAEQSGRVADAMQQYREIIARDPMKIDAYRGIYTLALQGQAYDEAWCCAAVLAFVGRANEEEQRFFEDWRPTDIPKVGGRMDNELWSNHLFHADEDRLIGKIFESVAGAALKAKIETLKARKELPVLPAEAKQNQQSSTVSFARAFWWAAEVLAIRPPDLYVRNDVGGGLVAVPQYPPASLAGTGVLTGLGPLERAFVAGQHLAMNRGEHYIKTLFPTQTELTVILFAAIKLIAPQTPAPQEQAQQVQVTAQSLVRFMEPIQREQLKVAVNNFLKAGGRANIKRWGQAVETTAARCGLLLAGDLEVAKKVIAAQQQIPGDLSPQERLMELMGWSVSDSYFVLRKKLGINIRPDEA